MLSMDGKNKSFDAAADGYDDDGYCMMMMVMMMMGMMMVGMMMMGIKNSDNSTIPNVHSTMQT